MRVDAILSQLGICSRREAVAFLKRGRVSFEGEVLKSPSQKLADNLWPEGMKVDGEPLPFPHGLYVALHKPVGYICSHKEQGQLVDELLPSQWQARKGGVQSVGRLDKETSGLLLFSDDGQFVHALTSPKRHVAKIYYFRTETPIPPEAVELFASGEFMLQGERSPCLAAQLQIESESTGRLTLHEGRYHQVRRMLAAVGAPVMELHRESIGALHLADLGLAAGEWVAIDPSIFKA